MPRFGRPTTASLDFDRQTPYVCATGDKTRTPQKAMFTTLLANPNVAVIHDFAVVSFAVVVGGIIISELPIIGDGP
jgi:hypothetical protein